MKLPLVLVLALGLTGCAGFQSLLQTGAQANDAAALAAETTLCRGISVGAWVRAYGSDPERAKAWRVICDDQIEVLP